jgi:hypothetical protein
LPVEDTCTTGAPFYWGIAAAIAICGVFQSIFYNKGLKVTITELTADPPRIGNPFLFRIFLLTETSL